MTIAVGDHVALYVPVANSVAQKRSGNFVFGVAVVDGGTNITVQWENGAQSQVEEAYLDKIIPIVGVDEFGKVVKIAEYQSPEYQGIVLMTYDRQLTGAGALTPYALIQLLSTGAKMEVPTSLLSAVKGR